MPTEVVQDILGHVNIQTTRACAKTRERRIAVEASKHFARNAEAAAKRREKKWPATHISELARFPEKVHVLKAVVAVQRATTQQLIYG